jgi:integrase
MRGSIRKRCQCRDADGRRKKSCRKAHGSWAFTIDVGNDPTTGKRKQIVRSGFRTQDEAETAMTKALAALDAGVWTDDKGLTVGTWLTQWLAELGQRDMSPKTVANYRSHVRDVWIPRLGELRLRDLRRGHVERVLADIAKPTEGERPTGNVGRRVPKRSKGTVQSYRQTIRAGLSVALRRGMITVNPAAGRMDALPPGRDETDLTVWEPEETARFLGHVADDRLSALYELAAYGGMRRAELCGLRWSDIDADGLGLNVRQTIVEVTRSQVEPGKMRCPVCGLEHVGRFFKPPKSKAGRRWVPLAGPARAALDAHRVAQRSEREAFGDDYDDHDLVFCEIDGKPLRPGSVTTAFVAHVAACGLPVVRLHDTRHGACSLLLAGGVPIDVVQMVLGHSSPEVTRRVYAHVMRRSASEQVEAASELLTRHRREQSVSKTEESEGPDEDDTDVPRASRYPPGSDRTGP